MYKKASEACGPEPKNGKCNSTDLFAYMKEDCEDSACSKKKGDFKTAIGKTSERYLPQ
jgi:hypothetical protein